MTEENLLGGAAEEFEGAEGLSPPKSSRITGNAGVGSGVGTSVGSGSTGGGGLSCGTPTGTPFGTPSKPTPSVTLSTWGKGLFGSLSSIASASR